MRSRSFVAVALTIVCLLAGSAVVLAYDSSQRDVIADGITIGGVDVGGLSSAQARARLRAIVEPRLQRTLVLRYGARRFVLRTEAARVRLDFRGAVDQALQRSRAGNLLTRAVRGLTGGSVHASFEPQVHFSTRAVTRFTARVVRAIDQPAPSASISFSVSSLGAVPSQRGVGVRTDEMHNRVEAALGNSSARARSGCP